MGGRGRQISEFEVSLVYRVSSRTAKSTQRNPVSKNKNNNKKQANKQTEDKREMGKKATRIPVFKSQLYRRNTLESNSTVP